VSLAQLVGTMHNICKVRGSNIGHHQKNLIKRELTIFLVLPLNQFICIIRNFEEKKIAIMF